MYTVPVGALLVWQDDRGWDGRSWGGWEGTDDGWSSLLFLADVTISIPDELVTKGSTTITAGGVYDRAIRSGDGEMTEQLILFERSQALFLASVHQGTQNHPWLQFRGWGVDAFETVLRAHPCMQTHNTYLHTIPSLIFKGLSGLKFSKIKKKKRWADLEFVGRWLLGVWQYPFPSEVSPEAHTLLFMAQSLPALPLQPIVLSAE